MKKSTTISKLIVLVLFLMHNVVLAQNQTITVNGSQIQVSSTLQTVLNQAETIYIKPIFENSLSIEISLSTFLNKTPNFAPLFIGLIMHRQELMLNEILTIEHIDNLSALEEEIFTFLEQLAEAHKDSNPMDNSYMPAAKLKVLYQDALKGNQNAICKSDFGIDPTTVDIEYLLDRSPNPNNVADNTNDDPLKDITPDNIDNYIIDEFGALRLKVKDENEIRFLGEVAPHADNFPSGHKDKKKWDPSKPFTSNIIIGTWYSDPLFTKSQITFTKAAEGYTARASESESSYTLLEVRSVKGEWDQPEKNMYWREHYIATKWFIIKESGSKERKKDMSFYISPYRDTMVLKQAYQSHGFTWTVYKPF